MLSVPFKTARPARFNAAGILLWMPIIRAHAYSNCLTYVRKCYKEVIINMHTWNKILLSVFAYGSVGLCAFNVPNNK